MELCKVFPLLLILVLTLSTPLTVKPACSAVPKPSVPEFTLRYVSYPYHIPPTYEIDPYTGKNKVAKEGQYSSNESIEVTVKNQPFTPYYDEDSNYISLYYNVKFKGHYGDEWAEYLKHYTEGYFNASQSDYTVISLNLGNLGIRESVTFKQIDFQVEALIGYETVSSWFYPPYGHGYSYTFTGETSGWSNTKTITLSLLDALLPSNNIPTVIPMLIIALVILFSVLIVSVVVLIRYLKDGIK